MATVLFNSQYADYNHNAKKKVPLNKLFVEIYMGTNPKLTRVALSDLYIIIGEKDGVPATRQIKSYEEFQANLKKNKVFNSATATQPITHKLKSEVKVQYKQINVPNTYNSTSIDRKNAPAKDIVPYGLKRNLTVTQATSKEDDNYLLAEVGTEQIFLKKNEIYYRDSSDDIVYLDKNTDFSKLNGVTFYTKAGKPISRLYVENEYVFSKLNAKETVNTVSMTKTTYEVKESFDEKGKLVVDVKATTVKLDKYISEQTYVTVTEDDEKRPGKTKTVSKVAVRNFEINSEGDCIAVNIGSSVKVVKLTELKDENGNDIADIKTMVGKVVKIKQEDNTFIETKPLTYEQVNILYSVKKFHKKVEKEPSENTFIKLKNGEYVKEMETIQPICYSFVKKSAKDFDAYLVRKITASGVQDVIVGKDYFEKHGDTAEMNLSNAFKIKRSQFKNCDIIQTTSKNAEVEQCKVLKSYNEATKAYDADIENKDATMLDEAKAFIVGYSKGLYNLDAVYINGKLEELEAKKNRYEITDTMYYNDNAEKSVTTVKMSIENGKIVGGPRYNVKRANKNGFRKLWTTLGYVIGPALFAGLFAPAIAPIISAALIGSAVLGSIGIPVWNAIAGAIKNSPRMKFKDKTKVNRKVRVKEIQKETNLLYERMTNDKVYIPLSEKQFLEQFDLLENKIISLAATDCENGFEVKNGVAEVNAGNINKAKKFRNVYLKEEKKLKKLSKEAIDANDDYEKLKKKVEKYQNEGKRVPAKLQAKFDKAKEEKEAVDKKYNDLKTSHDRKFNNYVEEPDFHEEDKAMKKKMRIAKEMKVAVYLKKFPNSDVVKEFMSTLSDKEKELLKEMKFNVHEGLYLGDWILSAKSENVKNHSKKDKEYIDAWLGLQEKINGLTENIEQKAAAVAVEEKDKAKPEEIAETPKPIEPKVEKTRLSKKTLEDLLSNINKLAELDELYLSADDEIPSDIDDKIAKLEEKIERDKHLLSKAMKSSTNAYHVYKERIIEAEKSIKKHKISYNNKKNIRITV